MNFLDVVKTELNSLRGILLDRMKALMQYLEETGFRSKRSTPRQDTVRSPVPVSVYFENVPRGPISKRKGALLECLPRWGILSISFIGSTVTEIVCQKGLVEWLVATIRTFSYLHFPSYEPTITLSDSFDEATKLSYKAACLGRWHNMAETMRKPTSETWYQS